MKNMKLQNPSLRKRKGFTLIELIVVIAILAILAAIAIPTFLGVLADSKAKADTATLTVLKSAAHVYIAENPTVAVGDIDMTDVGAYIDDFTNLKWSDGSAVSDDTLTVSADGAVSVVRVS